MLKNAENLWFPESFPYPTKFFFKSSRLSSQKMDCLVRVNLGHFSRSREKLIQILTVLFLQQKLNILNPKIKRT